MTHETQSNGANDQSDADTKASDEAFAPIARRLAEANAAIEPPATLVARIEARIDARSAQRRPWWTVSLAAAAALAVTASAWLIAISMHPAGDTASGTNGLAQNVAPPPEAGESPVPARRARVGFRPEAPFFTVPVETESPNVTIVMVYRDVTTPTNDNIPTTQGSEL